MKHFLYPGNEVRLVQRCQVYFSMAFIKYFFCDVFYKVNPTESDDL